VQYLGDITAGSIIDLKFVTANKTGAPTALTSGAISVYKDNSTTESTTGVTLTASFDSRTGMNHVRVDTSADGTFYAAGSNFQVVLTAGTVDSVSVNGYVVASFSIAHRSALRPATAGRTLVVDTNGRVDVSLIGGSNATTAIKGEVVNALSTDTYAEPGQGAPGATISLAAKIGYLFKAWRNRTTQTSSEYALYADDGTTKDQKATVSDDGTTLDRGEVTTGA
jgi:hypothetical protein